MSLESSTKAFEQLLSTDHSRFLAAKMWLGMGYPEIYHPGAGGRVATEHHQYLNGGATENGHHQNMMHEYNAPIMNEILHFQQQQQQQQQHHHHHQMMNGLNGSSLSDHQSSLVNGHHHQHHHQHHRSRVDANSTSMGVSRGGSRGGRRTDKRSGSGYSRGGSKAGTGGNRTGTGDKQ